jgi:hypothetical protein
VIRRLRSASMSPAAPTPTDPVAEQATRTARLQHRRFDHPWVAGRRVRRRRRHPLVAPAPARDPGSRARSSEQNQAPESAAPGGKAPALCARGDLRLAGRGRGMVRPDAPPPGQRRSPPPDPPSPRATRGNRRSAREGPARVWQTARSPGAQPPGATPPAGPPGRRLARSGLPSATREPVAAGFRSLVFVGAEDAPQRTCCRRPSPHRGLRSGPGPCDPVEALHVVDPLPPRTTGSGDGTCSGGYGAGRAGTDLRPGSSR